MLNIDYLPTFIAIGNGEVDKSIDGRSVLADLEAATAAAERPTVEGRDFLVEYFGEHGAPAKGGACALSGLKEWHGTEGMKIAAWPVQGWAFVQLPRFYKQHLRLHSPCQWRKPKSVFS